MASAAGTDELPRHPKDRRQATLAPSDGVATHSAAGEDVLQRVALAFSRAGGPDACAKLAAELANILDIDGTLVVIFDNAPKTRARTLVVWLDRRLRDNFECDVAKLPWSELLASEFRIWSQDAVAAFGLDPPFPGEARDCYVAHPLIGPSGDFLGALVAMKRTAFEDTTIVESLLKIFALRIAVDIERSRGEEALRRAAVTVSSAEGEEVFPELVRVLATIVGVEIAFIALPTPDDSRVLRMLAFFMDGHIVEDFEYPRMGTPCDHILHSGYCAFPDRLAERFPDDAAFKAMGIVSYAGLPLAGPDGATLGIISVASRKVLSHPELVESMLKIFAARARTEIERLRSESALRASEEQYRAIFNASADALVLWDSSLRRVDVNPAYERLHGYTRDEVLRSDYRSGLPIEFAERRRELVRRSLAGERCEVEMESVRKNGERFDAEVRTIPVSYQGQPHVLAIVRDVTERKRIEAAARASEEQYRAIFNASIEGMALWDERARIVDANPAFLQMLGFDRAEIEEADCRTFIPDEGVETCTNLLRTALGGERSQGEHVTRHKSGTLHSMEIRAVPIQYHGRPHALWLVRDITERKRTDAALRTSEAQYRAIFNAWADALVLRDADFRIVDVNATYERFTGRTRGEVLGIDHVIANPPGVDERVKALHDRVLKGETVQLETQLLHADGSSRELELRGVPIWHQGKPHVLYIGRDITTRKQADRERIALEAQLRQAQKMEAIGQLTGGIAHDFNNILQTIVGYIVLAEERQDELMDLQLGRYLDQVNNAARRAGSLVRQMLTFSRGQGGDRRPLSLAPLIREVTQMLRSTLPSTITLRTRSDDNSLVVLIDPVQFEQVLLNLSINARDAMHNSGEIVVSNGVVEIHDAVCASCRQRVSGRLVELSVRDSGPGIPETVAERMFEPFFTTKEVGKGSGMGLAMVHGIVHNHGGHLLVDSVLGEGTAVRVLLSPVDAADAAGQIEHGTGRIVTARQPLQGRVLVAEDEDAIRELLYELLTGWGLEVAVSTTGMEAMAAFAQDPGQFDLLITDQTMPGMTGLALARQVTQLRADIPVVLCTGFADDIQKEELTAAGIRMLARKPFEPVEFHAILRDVLATVRG